MASLVHFEEKVHRKKLQRADTIPLAQSTPVPTEQGELLIETTPPTPASPTSAPPMPMPEAISVVPPMTPIVQSVAPTTSEPSITISALEFRGLTAILRQIQQHLSLLSPPQPNLPTSSEPLAPIKDIILAEDTTTEVQIPPP
ncbi:hypothetical protein CK203_058399 [Vitis vinifera]|uniref:Uncharacterized protein n=1 Tax=Vitis vinifera TaxID=29760 RepID=A0A438GIA7_VITVI|nr:hypothetical protein CK203_058399 [Vitis vinifera]